MIRFGRDWDYSLASGCLAVLRYSIILYLVPVVIVLAIGLVIESPFLSGLVLLVLTPLAGIAIWVYHRIKRRMLRAKSKRFADQLDRAASQLRLPRPHVTEFDILLSGETYFVWEGIVAPSLISSMRLLEHTKSMLLSEELGRNRDWDSDHGKSPWEQIATDVESMATSIRADDRLATFEALGKLLELSVNMRRTRVLEDGKSNQKEPGRERELSKEQSYSEQDFLSALHEVAEHLSVGAFFKARKVSQDMLIGLTIREFADEDQLGWYALISYWLWIQLSALARSVSEPRFPFWASQNELLATQLEAVIRAYSENNYVHLSEVLCESFDWRTRVPRFLL